MNKSMKWSKVLTAVCIGLFAATLSSNAFAGKKRRAASAANERGANAYCEAEKRKGNECYVRRGGTVNFGCKSGWTKGKRFGGKGKDYVTCKRSKRHVASVDNKKKADSYCQTKKGSGVECKVVAGSIKGCGRGWSKAQTYRGKGKDYLACTRSSRHLASKQNKSEADAYCRAAKAKGNECKVKKSNVMGCGNGWTKVQKFNGKGKDYIACERSKRHLGTKKNKSDAEAFCKRARSDGKTCKVIRANPLGCGGKKWSKGGKFKGKGKDYLACTRNTWNVKMRFTIAGPNDPTLEAWLLDEIKETEKLYSTDPALKITPEFKYATRKGGKDLWNLRFADNKERKRWMDKHFDHVATSKTTGYFQVLVVNSLTIGTGTPSGVASFPHSVKVFGRKTGLIMQMPGTPERSACMGNHHMNLAHEMGHNFGLKHTFDTYRIGGRCNKDYVKNQRTTRRADGKWNVMDYFNRIPGDANGCWPEVYLNKCQQDRAARRRKDWMTTKGKVNYRELKGKR